MGVLQIAINIELVLTRRERSSALGSSYCSKNRASQWQRGAGAEGENNPVGVGA